MSAPVDDPPTPSNRVTGPMPSTSVVGSSTSSANATTFSFQSLQPMSMSTATSSFVANQMESTDSASAPISPTGAMQAQGESISVPVSST